MGKDLYYKSYNHVFVDFKTIPNNVEVYFEGELQESYTLMEYLTTYRGAKDGYGIGYAGTNGYANVSYSGHNHTFSPALKNIPWGRAVLCQYELIPAVEEHIDESTGELIEATKEKIMLSIIRDKSQRDTGFTGICYGTSIKDNTVQISCGFGIGLEERAHVYPKEGLESNYVLAVFVNAHVDDGKVVFGKKDTVCLLADGVDPTVFNAPYGIDFFFSNDGYINHVESCYHLTIRGNFIISQCTKKAKPHSSFFNNVADVPERELIDGVVDYEWYE